MPIVNVVPLQVEQLTGRLAWEQRISAVDDPALLPGATNYALGGNLNAFIDAIDQLFQQGQDLGLSAFTFQPYNLGGMLGSAVDISGFVRVNGVDPNPAEGTASGAELGDRIYIPVGGQNYDILGNLIDEGAWIVALYNGFWYEVPPLHGPLNAGDPWASPASTVPHIEGYRRIDIIPGVIPMPRGEDATVWRPGLVPELEPAGVILPRPPFPGDDDFIPPNGNGNGMPETPGAPKIAKGLVPLALGAAALFLIMD